jgi:hypothetical protein
MDNTMFRFPCEWSRRDGDNPGFIDLSNHFDIGHLYLPNRSLIFTIRQFCSCLSALPQVIAP